MVCENRIANEVEEVDRLRLTNAAMRIDLLRATQDQARATAGRLRAEAAIADGHAQSLDQPIAQAVSAARNVRVDVNDKYSIEPEDMIDVETGTIMKATA